jgi:hypothetical protein
MYGTTMVGTLAKGVTAEKLRGELEMWEKERQVPGFVSSHVLIGDDGRTIINVAVFEDKKSYLELADDPAQDKWWSEHYAPLLDGEPKWIDGDWIT